MYNTELFNTKDGSVSHTLEPSCQHSQGSLALLCLLFCPETEESVNICETFYEDPVIDVPCPSRSTDFIASRWLHR